MTSGRVLTWGVLPSFVDYVESFGGSVKVDEPALRDADGRFVFPEEDHRDDVVVFAGEVRFAAHGGLLDVRVRRPGLSAHDTAGSASLRVLSIDGWTARGAGVSRRIDIAEVQADGTATLLPPGVGLFDGRYAPGHPLATVEVSTVS